MLKILFVSSSPLKKEISIGNTFINLFKDIEDVEFASIYTRAGTPDPEISQAFCITEKMIIKNLINKTPVGVCVEPLEQSESPSVQNTKNEQGIINFIKSHRWTVFFYLQDFIWQIGRWKSPELAKFIADYNPDLVFTVLSDLPFLNKLILHIVSLTKKKLVLYAWDNNYSLKQLIFSPLRWIRCFISRISMRKVAEKADLFYVISDVQKIDYEKSFKKNCKVLTKCADFSDERKPAFKDPDEILKMVYAGNISCGRYEILAELAKSIEKLNSGNKKFQLDIYTLSHLTDKQKNNLSTDSVRLCPPVGYTEIREIQKNSDILIHAESFNLKEKLAVRQSFSTKIVDYLETNRCIFAIGDDYCSSIQYFIKNDCGLVATKKEDIEIELLKLHNNRDLLKKYAQKGWESGKKYHHKPVVQNMVINDLNNLINRK